MAQPRKTLTQHAEEIEQWIAQGWLTGHETFIELQDMATITDLIYREAAWSADVQAEIFGIKGRFQEVLGPLMPRGAPRTILEALQPMLDDAHGEAKLLVDLAHPDTVAPCQVVVHSDDVDTFA